MASIFISYRRVDTLNDAEKLHNSLENYFGKGTAFYDDHNLKAGTEWKEKLEKSIRTAKIVLVLYGGVEWLGADEWHRKRIDNPKDWVRWEIEIALTSGALVIPVLLRNSKLPPEDILPKSIRPLLNRQFYELRDGKWNEDLSKLLRDIEKKVPKYSSDESKSAKIHFDPLLNLPIHESIGVPNYPFKGLPHFNKEDARIFFGRNQEVKDLFEMLQNSYRRLILYYGQSGVGKSSLLDAGLLSRLSEDWFVENKSRRTHGLFVSIINAFRKQLKQNKSKKSLLIIDQLEEMFIDKSSSSVTEMAVFSDKLGELLEAFPQTHIILSFREEYLAPIRKLLKDKLTYVELYLLPIKESGLIEAITGIARDTKLAACFQQLSFEEKLPKTIAVDMLNSGEEAYTPLLQIILRDMWDKAEPQNGKVFFTKEFYKSQKKLSLKAFFDEQLKELASIFPAEIKNGLILDVLHLFVTRENTVGAHSIPDLKIIYPHNWAKVERLLPELENKYLLTGYIDEKTKSLVYRLTHDSMAVIITDSYNRSEGLGPQARRFLENALHSRTKLTKQALFVILDAEFWMRMPEKKEKELIEQSKQRLLKAVVKHKITQNKLKEAIDLMAHQFGKKNDKYNLENTISILKSYEQLIADNTTGVIVGENFNVGKNRLRSQVLHLSDSIDTIDSLKVRKDIYEEIIQGHTLEALLLMDEFLEEFENLEYINDIKIIISRYYDNEFSFFESKLTSFEEYYVERARIAHGIVSLLESVFKNGKNEKKTELELKQGILNLENHILNTNIKQALETLHQMNLNFPNTYELNMSAIVFHNFSILEVAKNNRNVTMKESEVLTTGIWEGIKDRFYSIKEMSLKGGVKKKNKATKKHSIASIAKNISLDNIGTSLNKIYAIVQSQQDENKINECLNLLSRFNSSRRDVNMGLVTGSWYSFILNTVFKDVSDLCSRLEAEIKNRDVKEG